MNNEYQIFWAEANDALSRLEHATEPRLLIGALGHGDWKEQPPPASGPPAQRDRHVRPPLARLVFLCASPSLAGPPEREPSSCPGLLPACLLAEKSQICPDSSRLRKHMPSRA